MINIVDTYQKIDSLFENGVFRFDKWELYINAIFADSATIFINDMNDGLNTGDYSYEADILPILNAVYEHSDLEALHASFCTVTKDLNKKVLNCFGHELDIDIVLYVGFCNAAGWVTNINGRETILLGIEKILELHWHDEDSMRGLIYHELGHAYHKRYGNFAHPDNQESQYFVWQLFTEGVAMCFEQALVGDDHYYHQNKDGWLDWCDIHYQQIVADFDKDLLNMNRSNQRYFGDWANYYNKGDVGYYIGARFVQFLCDQYPFEQIIKMQQESIYQAYLAFVKATHQ